MDQSFSIFKKRKNGGEAIEIHKGFVKDMRGYKTWIYFLDGTDYTDLCRIDFNGDNYRLLERDVVYFTIWEDKIIANQRALDPSNRSKRKEINDFYREVAQARMDFYNNAPEDEAWKACIFDVEDEKLCTMARKNIELENSIESQVKIIHI